jgi:transcriptional regulator with XRE-family HTH domain
MEETGGPDIVGRRLKRIRQRRGLTLRQLAAQSGVALATLSWVENGRRQGANLTLDTGRKLAEALGVTLDWLAGVYRKDEDEETLWPAATADACRLTVAESPMPQAMASAAV